MKSIRREVTYPHPPALVWRALTDPTILAQWLMESTIEPRVGHRFEFRTKPRPGFDGIVRCEVLECDPPRRLVYSWGGGPAKSPSTVAWTLVSTEGGTRLVLEHSGFHGFGGFFMRTLLGSGWGRKLTSPEHLLDALRRLAAESTNGR